MHETIRPAAVAGSFYPASRDALEDAVARLLAAAHVEPGAARPKALVVPHAGYAYSGPVAATAYALLAAHAEGVTRVVIVGPAHRVPVEGLASPGATHMRTPLGDVAIDVDAIESLGGVRADERAHAKEHSLEVELPFVQRVVPGALVVPLLVGRAPPAEVARVLDASWGGRETVVLVSSDLSHYLPYDVARDQDERTAARIVALDTQPLDGEKACGAAGINGLLVAARARGMRGSLLDLRSSGDTAGPRDEVVGYGAFAFYERSP